ncbi:MAG: N-acetyltransferase [Gammaproteobacteria bacterium]|uniref:GNAT family N-acetyltransferase n=1 Tax=Hydrogenophaga sp. TaxID=1904254 RepID=UPI0025C31856|nr:N-acetyltransferase [Hydrogenophaga sp.]MBU4182422.1 N-acetyltransferase [Gammaproteobacteria bacterium]MBU4283269.1 N-acetyltransferase [Gammaproteobacteria bacterium]MBU4325556.1 N-acetyltransferase [Gammaproteobacteria bacterium]MBU4507372.1 N-acetyltransferase [Gammaproteobacteria bacterium]MCG2654082.1 N-acetyltransferase [Hydrogenophaga sp.]
MIRPETPADADAIAALTTAAFLNAPHSSHTEAFIVNALRRAGALSVSLVAEQGGELVGHVATSPVVTADGTPGWHGLGPISVLPDHQGKGIGSALVQAALQALREQGAAGIMLVGEPGYYRRFGFRNQPQLVYPDIPPEYFIVLPFTDALPRGTVLFHEAFGATS